MASFFTSEPLFLICKMQVTTVPIPCQGKRLLPQSHLKTQAGSCHLAETRSRFQATIQLPDLMPPP